MTVPREPCFKFNAAMGLRDASQLMLAQPGQIEAVQPFRVKRGTQGLRVDKTFAAKRLKHFR